MKRAEKAERILDILDDLYPTTPIPLDHRDAFTLLIAVLLSAQCTDERVNQVTPALFAAADSAAAMARLSESEILSKIRSCGLAPSKARNIRALARQLVERHGGEVPRSFEALEALPGVGHKTASVVMSQAFGEPAFPVDTHIHRLAARWGLSDGSSVEHTERDLKSLFPESSWNRLHLAIIYFGREHCPARGHDLSACPICSWAATRKRIHEEQRAGGGGPRSRAKVVKKVARKRAKGAAGKSTKEKVKKAAKKVTRKVAKHAAGKGASKAARPAAGGSAKERASRRASPKSPPAG